MEIANWPVSKRLINTLLRGGYYNEKDIPEYIDDIENIPGMGPGNLSELREWLFQKYNRRLPRKPRPKKRKLESYDSAKEILTHLIKDVKSEDFGRQLRMADSLLKKYNKEILLSTPPKPGIYSLSWYLADYGDKYIRSHMPAVVITEEKIKQEEVILDEPAELEVTSAPKSLKDFLKL